MYRRWITQFLLAIIGDLLIRVLLIVRHKSGRMYTAGMVIVSDSLSLIFPAEYQAPSRPLQFSYQIACSIPVAHYAI